MPTPAWGEHDQGGQGPGPPILGRGGKWGGMPACGHDICRSLMRWAGTGAGPGTAH